MADNLLDYIRENPGELTAELWSGIALTVAVGETVSENLPMTYDQLSRQLQALVQVGSIECRKGRWHALEIRNPPPAKQPTMF